MSKSINIKKTRGFTIVELLVVIVVIGILAAISIVSYSGVTNRANKTSAQSAASGYQRIVEFIYNETAKFPTKTTEFTSPLATKPTGYSLIKEFVTNPATEALSNSNGKTSIAVLCYTETAAAAGQGCETASLTIKGVGIKYWNFDGTASEIVVGETTTNLTPYLN